MSEEIEPTSNAEPKAKPKRRRALLVTVSLVVVAAIAVAGVLLWQREQDRQQQAELLQQWSTQIDQAADDALALLPDPAVRLAPYVSGAATEPAETIEALRAECDRAAALAVPQEQSDAVAPPADLRDTTPGYAEQAERAQSIADAVAAYAESLENDAPAIEALCAGYPDLAQLGLDQAAAEATFEGLLTPCELSATGCVPLDTATWPSIADALDAAFTQPAQHRADLLATGCPTAQLASVCTLESEQAAALVPLYQAYGDALRAADRAGVTTARQNLDTTIAGQLEPLQAAVTQVLPGADVTDPRVAIAQAIGQSALDGDRNRLAAESALLSVVG